MSDIKVGIYVSVTSGKEYAVVKKDMPLSEGRPLQETELNFGPYMTECGLYLCEHSDNKLFCSELGEFLIKA